MFVNHVTTNPFFVPTHYGAAGRVLAARHAATSGRARRTSDIGEMVNAFNAAISAEGRRHRGLPRRLTAFNGPTNRALGRGIPVVATTPTRTNKPAGLHRPGPLRVRVRDGQADRRPRPSGDVALFIATPGQLNIQPRIDGAHRRDQAVRQGQDQGHGDRDRRRPARRAGEDRRLLPRAQEPQGDVRRRRRLDRRASAR